jgi:anti-sigma regulatory factor (Ser/Thr protein kinase)
LSQSTLLLKIELRSDPAMLGVVRGALARLTEEFGFSEAECSAIVRAVDEALTNIIRHGYHGRTNKPIEASFRSIRLRRNGMQNAALEILLEDRGVRVNPTKLHGRSLDDIRPGGLGLHFIRQSVDMLEFRHYKGKNRLRLVKFLDAPKARTAPEENP